MKRTAINSFIEKIGVTEWSQIKSIMGKEGVSYPGFAKYENVPTQFIKRDCASNGKICDIFLKATVETYINADALQCDSIPEANDENFIGVISLMLLKNQDNDNIQSIIEEFIKPSEQADEGNIVEKKINIDNIQTAIDVNIKATNSSNTVEIINNKSEESKMKTYLGYMDGIEGQYYNFFPIYEYNGVEFLKIENPEEEFPWHGNFAVHTHDYHYDKETDIKIREFCIINLEESDITQNINPITGELKNANYKIFIDDIAKDKKLLTLSTNNIYPIVTPVKQEIDFSKDTIIDVIEEFPVFKYMTKSVLYYKGDYYGPFETGYRPYNRSVYINTKITENNFLVDKYTIVDNDADPVLYCEYYKPEIGKEKGKDFLILNDSLEKVTLDCVTDEILVTAFTKSLSTSSEESVAVENLSNILNEFKTSPFAQIPQNPGISKNRIERFTAVISNINKIKEMTNLTSELVQNMFMKLDDGEKNEIVDAIIKNPNFLNGIQRHKIVVSRIEEKENELEELQNRLDELKSNVRENALADLESKNSELENLKKEVIEKQSELDIITEKLGVAQDTEELQTLHSHYEMRYQSLERKINDKIDEAKNAATELSFDDEFDKMISLRMSEAFSEYQKNADNEKYTKIADKISSIPIQKENRDEFVNRIVEEVQKYRPTYDKNTILNIVICMVQGFLTILSGEPGTGKTSICKIIAHVLGLDNPFCEGINNVYTNRFSLISVEKGWNSKRDLIGYYNPLSKRIEKSNSDFYDSLKILSAEKNNSKFPMIVLLDEANLSPMEYYWADFVNISDDINKNVLKTLDLGDGQKIEIPTTLRFLATINNDHTTENISPRMIDRAFVISLPTAYSDKAKQDFDDSCDAVDWECLKQIFATSTASMETQANLIYEEIKNNFEKMGHPISPRVENIVKNYCSVAQNVFEFKDSIEPSIVALDYAVSQKLITKISGNGTDYRDYLIKLNTYCKEQNLNLTSKQLDRIIEHGNKALDYYEYFC